MDAGLGQSQRQSLSQKLAPQLRQGVRMLAMNLPDLRHELQAEMSSNPTIEEIEPTLEKTVISEKERESDEAAEQRIDEYPEEYELISEYARGTTADTEALDRRQRFFDNQTAEETLEQHLGSQLRTSGMDPKLYELAEMLIGDLNENGYYKGSIPDLMMVTGADEETIRGVLAKIRELDPPGCGATSPQECLLSQLDKLDGSPHRETVRRLIARHFDDMAKNRLAEIMTDLGITRGEYVAALKALRTLDPFPGRAYARGGRGVEYVNPEVHAVKCRDGYLATVDARSLPEIRISEKYLKMLGDPNVDAETTSYVRERIAHARGLIEAVEHRQETITKIAQAIFDAQPGFFERGLKGLRPLQMQEIADKTGVHVTTVSRTVNDKYASTPRGTVELRRFFTQAFTTDSGEQIAKDDVLDRIRAVVAAEDAAHPLSDDRIAAELKKGGFTVARRTVAKYRDRLGIPTAVMRRKA